jgi:hypothetical protein
MKLAAPFALPLALSLVLALSCSPANVAGPGGGSTGSGGTGGGDSGASDAAAVKACAEYAYAYCAWLGTCSSYELQFRFDSTTTCEAIENALCLAGFAAPATGSTLAGREACTSILQQQGQGWACADFIFGLNPPPDCQIAKGSLPNGATCAEVTQCQSGYCGYLAGGACGTCAPAPQAGGSCALTACPTGLNCLGSPPVCTAISLLGGACGPAQRCNAGLSCVSNVCQASVTAMNLPCSFTGAGCDIYDGLACNAASGTCLTATLAQPGQACGIVEDQNAPCVVSTCVRGVCVGNVPLGGACDLTSGPPCFSSTRCVVSTDGGTSGTCQLNSVATCP